MLAYTITDYSAILQRSTRLPLSPTRRLAHGPFLAVQHLLTRRHRLLAAKHFANKSTRSFDLANSRISTSRRQSVRVLPLLIGNFEPFVYIAPLFSTESSTPELLSDANPTPLLPRHGAKPSIVQRANSCIHTHYSTTPSHHAKQQRTVIARQRVHPNTNNRSGTCTICPSFSYPGCPGKQFEIKQGGASGSQGARIAECARRAGESRLPVSRGIWRQRKVCSLGGGSSG